jgi:hypothetical protein
LFLGTRGTISFQQDCLVADIRSGTSHADIAGISATTEVCLKLVDEAKEWYVRMALLQLAAEFKKKAEAA